MRRARSYGLHVNRCSSTAKRGQIDTLSLAAGLVAALTALTGCGPGTATAGAGPAPASQHAPVTTPASSPYFGALAGYGCPQSHQASFREAGWYHDGINGFLDLPAGGWRKQGCNGRFDAMPMSGSATRPDPGNYALWTFRTAPLMSGTCQVAVYVPADRSVKEVGGNPARYLVYDSARPSGPPAGSFGIDDFASLGRWASGGSYPLAGGVLTVKLSSAGLDWHGNVENHAHLPVTQVMAFCGPTKETSR